MKLNYTLCCVRHSTSVNDIFGVHYLFRSHSLTVIAKYHYRKFSIQFKTLPYSSSAICKTSKSTCPIVQAGACSIRSRLRRSHGWLCSIRSRLRRSHSALLIHYKKVELKKKIDLYGIQTYIRQSRVGCVTTSAHWTINFTENKCSIYYQLCLGCGLQECR